MQRGTCLLKCSAAASAYSASEDVKAPRALEARSVSGVSRRTGAMPSTPAEKECSQAHRGSAASSPRSAPMSQPGTATMPSAAAASAASSSEALRTKRSSTEVGAEARPGHSSGGRRTTQSMEMVERPAAAQGSGS